MELPTPDPHILARKDRIVSRLREVIDRRRTSFTGARTRAYDVARSRLTGARRSCRRS